MTGFALEVNEGDHCLCSRLLIKSDVEPIFSQFKPEAGPVFKAMKIIPLEELLLKL